MIPQFYRFAVFNNSGQLLTYNNNGRINLKISGFKVNVSTGKVEYTQFTDDDMGFGAGDSLADGAEIITGTEYDNTANGYVGLHCQLEITHDEGLAVTGTGKRFDLYISGGDATGETPSDASGYADAESNGLRQIGSVICEPNMADDDVVRSPVLEVL